MPDLPLFFAQAWRVLKPGGRLVVCAWLSGEHPPRWQQRRLLEPICREGRMPHMGTTREYERLATAAGFVMERSQDVSQQVAQTWPRIARIFLRKLLVQPRYLRFLFNRHARNRIFALTMFRIWLAYRTGAMRYGIFTARKPEA
jgi:tocopherol O-methyltransferase